MTARSETTRLLRKARDGDREAINQLYDRIGNRLLALVKVRLGGALLTQVEAEDVVQEVMIKALDRFESFEQDNSRSLFAWLAIIAANTIRDLVDYHQGAKRDMRCNTPLEPEQQQGSHRGALSGLIRDHQLRKLEQALLALSENDREIILLRDWEERSYREISELIGGTSDACRMQHTRALARLSAKFALKNTNE